MNKIIVGLITICLILCNIFFCYSTVGENLNKKIITDDYSVSVFCDNNTLTVYPNETAVYVIEIINTGSLSDTYVIDCPDLIDCCYWSSLSLDQTTLNPGESCVVILTVEPYIEGEETYIITVRVTSTGDPLTNDSVKTFTTVLIDDRIINVSTDESLYEIGESIELSLMNINEDVIEGNPTFEVFNEDYEIVYGCYPDCWITLNPGESFNDIWIPDIPQGKYTVEGVFLTYEDEYFDDESFFIFDNNPIMVTTDKKIYEPGEMVNLKMTNVENYTIDGNPSFIIYNFNDEIVHEVYIYLWIELDPNETFDDIWWDQKDKYNQQVPDGVYKLIGQLTDSIDKIYVDDYWFYIGENLPPNPPVIIGPTNGEIDTRYEYTFLLPVDPEGDSIFLRVDWDDDGPGKWLGPFTSGTKKVNLNHTWYEKGNYVIKAQTMDYYGSLSEWATLEVSIPRTRSFYNSSWLNFLELFPIIKEVISRLIKK